ncbi:HU domain-containing protein [Phocaeicola sp.]
MIELARHIEILLLENDCVIIPDFGGFIAHYQPARYIKEENLYLPPVRTIGFNPQLTINDGLLVQSYMQAYHTDFPDATRMIEKEVAELKENLYKNGYTEMHGIGMLHYNIRNTYEFHPNEDGALSPNLYGLSSFSINRLEQIDSTGAAIAKELLPKPVRRKRTLRFNRQWIGNAVAVAAAVILFFFLSVPVENTYVDKGNYASLGTDGLFEAIRSQSLATTLVTVPAKPQQPQKKNGEKTAVRNNQNTLKPVAVKVEKVAKAEETAPKNAVVASLPAEQPATMVAKPVAEVKPAPAKKEAVTATTPANQVSNNKKGSYCIIVSSLATASDAQQVLNDYKQKGYNEATVIEGNGRYRLSICRFADKAAAYKKLNELKQNEAFKNAWVLSSK